LFNHKQTLHSLFNNLINNDIKTKGELWEKIKTYFRTFEEWFNNNEYYHLIGFLIHVGKDVEQIKALSNNILKSDFRKELIKSNGVTTSRIITNSPDYKLKNIENRVNLGNPGKSQDVFLYSTPGKVIDSINSSKIYEGEIANHKGLKNDLVKFSIGVLKNDSSKKADFMHFRSFIDSFSDSYNAGWGSTQYAGRGDKFYNYQGFERKISMAFTVYAQSKAELIPMYEKLNFLASSLAPSYSTGGFM
jgi:hypothetical protein